MARVPRAAVGETIYHVLNRANSREQIFDTEKDYLAFEKILLEAKEKHPMRILSFCVMPNHWHMILHPETDESMPKFMRWITHTHTQRWHANHKSIGYGHLYQGRYKSFLIEEENYFVQACRYIERNPLRAGLSKKAQDWRWGSAWIRNKGNTEQKKILSPWPIEMPIAYEEWLNTLDKYEEEKLENIRLCIKRSRPFGSDTWVKNVTEKLGLTATMNSRGGYRRKDRNEGT